MGKAGVKITAKSSKSGTKVASSTIRVTGAAGKPRGKRMFQTKAQLTVRVETTQNGQPRPKSRS